MNLIFQSSLIAAALFALVSRPAYGQAEKIAAEQLPTKVKDAVKARFPGATITQATKETENGAVIYDIEMTRDGKKHEMDCKEDGTLVDIQNEIPINSLPAAVASAIKAKYPGSTIKEAAEILVVMNAKEVRDHFEIMIQTADNKEVEVSVSLDGTKLE